MSLLTILADIAAVAAMSLVVAGFVVWAFGWLVTFVVFAEVERNARTATARRNSATTSQDRAAPRRIPFSRVEASRGPARRVDAVVSDLHARPRRRSPRARRAYVPSR